MLQYSVRRGAQTIPVALGVVTLVFMMLRFLPGDPAAFILGEGAKREAIEAVRQDLGLNRSIPAQYVSFIQDLAQLDLGKSIINRTQVTTLIKDALPTTLLLGSTSLILGFAIAVPLGTLAAYFGSRGKTWLDQVCTIGALSMDVIPGFWLALVLMLIFTLKLGWLPATGPVEFGDPASLARRFALPVTVLTVAQIGVIARVTRASVLEVLGDDYVRTARAMGTPELVVLFKHALRNAALPVVTVAGLSFGRLLGGTVIVESIFALPGMGTVIVNGILGRDYPVVQGVVLIYATIFILVNLATDIAYTRLDPRVSL
jgi:ABC-type dipeptide/oligopeptide/nickel transport system permease component